MTIRLSVERSRAYWLALMENVVGLVCDADTLFRSGSFGRARSLVILAQEELARATDVYELAAHTWSSGEGIVVIDKDDLSVSKDHKKKITAADVYGADLGPFWGDYSDPPAPIDAKKIDDMKQAGFYVARSPGRGGTFAAPAGLDSESVAGMLVRTAQVAEMALITDHSRMKLFSTQPYVSTGGLQTALLPIAHPEEFAEFMGVHDEDDSD